MASHENDEDFKKSPTIDKIDITTQKSKTNEKKSSVSLIDENSKSNNTVKVDEATNLMLDITENINVQRKDTDDIQNGNKSDLKSINKNDKKEVQDMPSPSHIQNSSKENIKSEHNKDSSTKAESILKQKKRSLRLE
jgi:hypothetical protein